MIFHTDDDRTFVLVEFPVHPVFAEALKSTLEVTPKIEKMLAAVTREMTRGEI